MATACEGCRFYTADEDTPRPCPACGGPMRFTLLPPPDLTDPAEVATEPAEPVAELPRRRLGDNPEPRQNLVAWLADSPLVVVGAVALYVLFLAWVWVVVARGVGDPDFTPADRQTAPAPPAWKAAAPPR